MTRRCPVGRIPAGMRIFTVMSFFTDVDDEDGGWIGAVEGLFTVVVACGVVVVDSFMAEAAGACGINAAIGAVVDLGSFIGVIIRGAVNLFGASPNSM